MKLLKETIQCPNCRLTIRLPIIPEFRIRELEEEYDMAEREAQKELFDLQWWLANASLFALLKFWLGHKRTNKEAKE